MDLSRDRVARAGGLRQPGSARGPLVLAGVACAGLALATLASLAGTADLLFWTVLAAFTVLCAVAFFTAGRHEDGTLDVLAPAAPFSLVLYVMFGLGSVYGWTGLDHKPDHPNPFPALVLATAGMAAFTIGYHLPIVSRARSLTGRLPDWRPRRAVRAAVLCLAVGAVATVAAFRSVEFFAWSQKESSSLDAESQLGFLADLLFSGLSILAITIASTMSRHRARPVLAILAVVVVVAFLPTGRRFYLFTVLASVGFAWHYYIGRIRPRHMALLGAFTILLLNPFGQIWRDAYRTIGATGPGDIPAVATAVGTAVSTMTAQDYLNYAIGDRFERLNEAATVAALRATVPSSMDFKNGETYLPIVTWVIPRFIWHDKPTFQYFNDIGHTAGLIGPFDDVTTIVYTSIGELYLNFGDLGVPLGMLVIGMLSRWLYQALMVGTRSRMAIFMYAILIMPLWSVEEALGPSMGGALRDIIAGVLVLRLCGALVRTGQRPSDSDNCTARRSA